MSEGENRKKYKMIYIEITLKSIGHKKKIHVFKSQNESANT